MNMQTLPEKWFIRKCKKEILGYHGGSLSFSFEEFLRWAGFESGGSSAFAIPGLGKQGPETLMLSDASLTGKLPPKEKHCTLFTYTNTVPIHHLNYLTKSSHNGNSHMETYMISLAVPTVQMFLTTRVGRFSLMNTKRPNRHLSFERWTFALCSNIALIMRVCYKTYNTQNYTIDFICLFYTNTNFCNVLEIK
jgi:hypothetical protein